jgi:hypothetical protein
MVARPGEYAPPAARIMPMMGRRVPLLCLAAAALAGAAAARADSRKPPPTDELDLEAVKPRLVFVHDGRGHYLALVPFDPDAGVFYGDGKTFYQQRVFSYSHDQSAGRASVSFWAPTSAPRGGEMYLEGGTWKVRCSDRHTPMLKLGEEESGKLLARAVFKKPMWKRQALTLGRDDDGTYYYVDRIRDDRPSSEQWDDPHPPTGFRLFVGRKGKLREQKLTDSTVDSKGLVLTTRRGRLVVDDGNKRVVWSRGKKREALVYLPVEDNTLLIYRDLGLYGKLGIPCDAL